MVRSVVGLVVVAGFAASVAGQDNAADVVKKAVAAHGGADALKKYPAGTSKLVGKVFAPAGELGFTGDLAFATPGKVRLVMAIAVGDQKVEVVQVVNGDKAKQTENGKPTDLSQPVRDELKESALIHELSLLVPLLDATKYTLAAEKDAALEGKDCAVVLVTAKGLKDTRLYFDKGTGLLAGMRRKGLGPDQKPVDELTTFGDYKAVEGVKVPMQSKVTHDGKPFLAVTVAEYKPAERLDDKLFAVE
ncbi:MAG: hypothetical protein K2X87_32930 [Gemmataceae bacterium]|nr:hypothetical protein [Gemmataceae bacterium]